MVIAGQRAYADAVRWIRSARPPIRRGRFARTAVRTSSLTGLALMSLIALADPNRFGSPGSRTLRTGWPSVVVIAVLAGCVLFALLRRQEIISAVTRVGEPYRRPLSELPSFDDAADALAACPGAFKTRFALLWVWRPLALVVVGVTCSFSTAYFVVDAILARGSVGWGQVLYACVFLAASFAVFAVSAPTVSTWRLSASVFKEVTSGY
jgi:hypothetical protein